MKVGIALNMLQKEGRSDADVFGEHMAMGDLAEPLGFDSIWALEHHFTGCRGSPGCRSSTFSSWQFAAMRRHFVDSA